MNLYLLVWECEEYAMEAEWTHFVSDKQVIEYEEQIKIATEFMRSNESDDDEAEYDIQNIWLNSVTQVDGYKIEVGAKS